MSTVENDRFSRSSRLDPASLNEKFSDITTVTTAAIDEDNVSKEGIDLANMDTAATNGISQIILRSAEQASLAASGGGAVTISANTNKHPAAPTAPSYLNGEITTFNGAGTISLVAGDIIRVYWSMNVTTNYSAIAQYREVFWAAWLQWDIGAGYVKVPGQGNFNDDITGSDNPGSLIQNMNAVSLVAHRVVLMDKSAGTATGFEVKKQPLCGSWYYRVTGATTLSGLRMVGAGLVYPSYDGVNLNCLRYADSDEISGTQQITFNEGLLSCIIMRDD